MSRIRRFLPPAAWMAAIFIFSTSLFSGSETGSVLEAIVRFFYPSASAGFIDTAHFIVRKTAHFTEYAFLAFLWHRALAGGRGGSFARTAMMSLVICVVYAMTDEFHQSFVPGRYASPVDVLIDSAGAAFALALMRATKKRTRSGVRA